MSQESRATRSERWAELLAAEEAAFQKAMEDSENIGRHGREARARDWFSALKSVLREYEYWHRTPQLGGPPVPYPAAAIRRVAGLSEHLALGVVPLLVDDVTAAGGRPSRSPLERRDIATALSFIKHVKDGQIGERAYNVRVSECFDVDRTTVQQWWKKRDEIMADIPWTPVAAFPDALERAGKRYQLNSKKRSS